jgi:peptide/nickel transport system substrate-binding protein
MNESKRGIGRNVLYTSIVGAMVLSIMPATFASSAAAAQTCRKIGTPGIDVCGRFLETWQKPGSEQNNVYVNGLPITAARNEISLTDGKTYSTQWFERARYEAHPENKAPYDVLLGLLGISLTEGRGSVDAAGKARNPADVAFVGVAQPADVSATKVWFPETKHTVTGKILEYWNRYGGLQQFGFPVSEQFKEVSATDGKTYDVQYFERNRFELHPEKAAPYEVELGLLGVQQYKAQAVAAADILIAPKAGDTTTKTSMVVGSSQEPDNMTVFNNALINSRMRRFVEMGLTDRDSESNPYPQIAWYVPTIENGGSFYVGAGNDRHLVTKYKMRRGIMWSDGKEVTSNDAAFYFRLVMNPQSPVTSRSTYQKLESVENPDKYTVIYNWRSLNQMTAYYNSVPDKENYGFIKAYIDLKRPGGDLAYAEVGGIYPMHVLNNISPQDIIESPFGITPIGAGPWKVQSWNKGQEMVLVENANYNLTAKPLIKTIRVKFITDVNQLLAQAKTGELDMIFSEAFSAPVADQAGLEAVGYKVVSRPATTWEHIDFRFDYAPFQDKAVRHAIAKGVNRKRVSDVVYLGTAGVMNSVVPPFAWHSLDNPEFAKEFPQLASQYKLLDINYDVAAANKLLDDAGWARGADGIRAKGGVKLSFEYGTTTQAARQQIQALVSADLKAIGVDAVTKNYPAGVFFDTSAESPRTNGTTKWQQFAWVGSIDSNFEVWTCASRWDPVTQAGNNNQEYCNAQLDAADGEYNASTSRLEIATASAKAQSILSNDVVVLPIVQRANIEVVRASLQNHIETSSQVTSNWNALQWAFR